mgnify:CR=1 FL=1
MTDDGGPFGAAIERREDPALLTGRARYTDDVSEPGTVHLAFARSRHAHARIEDVDVEDAAATDGVLAAFTWTDVVDAGVPGVLPVNQSLVDADVPGHPILARDRVRYHGQPIAAVVAENRAGAADGASAVDVDYDRLPATVDPVEATGAGTPTLFEDCPDNVLIEGDLGDAAATEDAFAAADRVIERELTNNRLIANAIEPRAAVATYDPSDGGLTVEMTSQAPHRHRAKLADTLGMSEGKIRVIAPDVGGGFGHKGHHHPGEAMAAVAAMELDRPVKWTATRSENYLEGAHGRDHATTAAIAVDDDGTIRGLRVDTHANVGGYALGFSPALATMYGRLLACQYDVPAIHLHSRGVCTNTAPVHSYRGAGRPEAVYVTERLVAAAARELGLDPAEMRRRNQVPADAFPHETPVGATYDSGDYATALETALDDADYEALRERQAAAREEGRYVGIGLACYVESTGHGFESGVVRVAPDGGVTVYAGTHSHGQGHETTYAQIVAEELGVDYDEIEVVEGDTEAGPVGTGTFGSRSAVTGGSAVAESARTVAGKAREIAAARLEAPIDDVVLSDEELAVRGAPQRSIPFEEVATAAYHGQLPEGTERGLEDTTFFEADDTAYSFGTHLAAVEVDPDTGEIEIERYLAVDDCGEQINPRIVEGQVHGGVAQGIGQALYEEALYDGNGQLVTGSMQDYAVPRAEHLPEIETDHTVTPSPHNPLGVKGIGEAGTIAAPPAIVNAVHDALAPLGIEDLDMPLTEETVWRAVEEAT